jgi:hypothetical protein
LKLAPLAPAPVPSKVGGVVLLVVVAVLLLVPDVDAVSAALAAPETDMILPARMPAVTRPAALRMFFFFIWISLLTNYLLVGKESGLATLKNLPKAVAVP